MRYRTYNVRQTRSGQIKVQSYGPIAQGFYYWLFALFLVSFVIGAAKDWYIWLPIIGAVVWLCCWGNRMNKRDEANARARKAVVPPTPVIRSAPPGWYQVGKQSMPRYWDGQAWNDTGIPRV